VTGGPTFTDNNVTIDPANTSSTDFAITQTWNPSGYDTLPYARLVCSVTASDNTSLNGTYTINHTGMGFVPDAVAYRLGGGTWQSVAITSSLTSTTVTISGLTNAVKGNLIIALNDGNGTLPVELSSFAAIVNASNFVDISWVSQSETNLSGYYVLRNSSNDLESASVVSRFVPAANSSTQNSYSYTDTDVYPGNWYYWLQSLDMNGAADYFGSLYVSVSNPGDNPPPVIPLQTALQNIYPNPFNPSTTISFDLSKSGSLDLAIYNLRGERICTLRSGNVEKGAYRQTWNGTDDAGRALPTGVYLVRMVADKYVSNRKLVLIK
jgi:hypothetical protein